MKLATFTRGGTPEIGLVQGDRIVPLHTLLPSAPRDMKTLIGQWDSVNAQIAGIAADDGLALDSVTLMAPVTNPGKIMAIGLNYADHVAEIGRELPEQQLWFGKYGNTVAGPFDPVQLPKASSAIDYEVELVAIIGKRGRHISQADAPAHVFGYCVGNDVSVRDWQRHTPQWTVAKSFDTHGPFGPWITTADEVGDPHRLGIRCLVNGLPRQNSNTKHLIFNIWAQIEYLSKAMTLEPGDIIFTGTPGGVGAAMNPRQFLKAEDRVRCEIDELGAIENVMTPEI